MQPSDDHTDPRTLPKRRIAVLTSGGDAPGMNGAVRSVVRMALSQGCEAYVVREGYAGLVQGGDMIREVRWDDVRGFLAEGGTLIGTARCPEFRDRKGRLRAVDHLLAKGIDALVIIGGDGSLTGADVFRQEWPGLVDELVAAGRKTEAEVARHRHLNIVGMVGSIDNDMSGTDATIGCYSALHRICEMVDYIDATAQSHQRAFVIEVMGRHCGWLALMAGVSCGADFIFIPENPPPENWEDIMTRVVAQNREHGKRRTIVIVAEGALDRNLTKITPDQVRDVLANRSKLDTRVTILGHIQRGGPPCAYDRMISTLQGAEAVKAVLEATPETPSPVICVNENKIVRKNLMDAVEETKRVTANIAAKNYEEVMRGRDAEFAEYYRNFRLTNDVMRQDMRLPPEKRLRIGIIHVGAPAGGMNAATRSAVAYCLARGHTPVALHNGFSGLCRHHDDKPLGSVRELEWIDADSWGTRGGSEIGCNRALPDEDIETVAHCFKLYNIQALFCMGGFEAFTSVSQLRRARAHYSAFKIPMVVIPATISNNVPGTEYSIGSDTCLNALVQYCDACRQSASSTRRRVFVIETQGGASGYIATVAGLSIGALAVYTPEEGISLDMIRDDIECLREVFARQKGQPRSGKIILRNEKASTTYTTEFIANMIEAESQGRFESRVGIPGHFQQGTRPSPIDRVRAARFGMKAVQHLETFAGLGKDAIAEDPMSASVIGIVGSVVKFSDVETVERKETDWKNRRPKNEFWMQFKELVHQLSGRAPGGFYSAL